ncbi:MAG TPA: type II CAAX endopeptidase family protein [Solirubrobacterales bacterium]
MQPPSSKPSEPGRLYRLGWTAYLLMAVAGILWIGFRLDGPIPLSLFLDPAGWWIDLLLGIGAGLLLLGLWRLGERLSILARQLEEELSTVMGPLTRAEAVSLAILSGFAEELFFRGAVQGQWGWLAATVLFAVLHTGPGRAFRVWTLFAVVAGGLFGLLMEWRGNLLAPVIAHFVVNGVNLRRLASRTFDSARLPPSEEEG